MENENPAPTTRQIFACWFTFCRAVASIGNGGSRGFSAMNQKNEAALGNEYADELMKREPR